MKINGIHVLVLVVVLALCAHETAGWGRWGRVWRRVVCGLRCGTKCYGIPPRCRFTCFRSCGRKRRSADDDGQMVPLAKDYHAYLCNEEKQITIECFKAVLKDDSKSVIDGFNAADDNQDGKLSMTEFAGAPFYFEGEGDGGNNGEGNGNQGDGNQGNGNQGDGNQGNGNQGDGNQGDNDKRELLETLEELHDMLEE